MNHMKQFLLSFMTLSLLAVGSAWATQVEVTMNAKSKFIKSLVNMNTQEEIAVGEPTSNKYSFDAPDGSYLLTATASDETTVTGTLQLDIDANHASFKVFALEVNPKNENWVLDTDYTLSYKVTDKEGNTVNTTWGEYTNGNKTFLCTEGNTYYVTIIPSDERKAEGYMEETFTGTVNFNVTIQAKSPMGYDFSVSAPANASIFIGTKKAHFVKFNEVEPKAVEVKDGLKVATYQLADAKQYNYRVSVEDKYTHAGVFTMSGDEQKRPTLAFTDDDFNARDPKFIDHDVTSNGRYNVGDIFLNINARGHLTMANVGDTYDLLPMRNWQLIDGITSNYFIEPDFHFTVVDLNGQPSTDVVAIDDEQLKAVGQGTAIVLVTYDALHTDLYNNKGELKTFVGGSDWSAIWPENTGVFVVTVGQQASTIEPNIIINKDYLTTVTPWGGGAPIDTKLSMENVDAEFDVLYFLSEEGGYDYTFTPEGVSEVKLARPVIGTNAASYQGFGTEGVTKNDDGSYTLRLTEGRNIVCLTDAQGNSIFQVITAKPCERKLLVGGEEVTSVKPGDAVTVQYSGLYHPAGKLAGIHNFNAKLSFKKATEGITVKDGKANQYTMAADEKSQAVTFTMPDDWQGGDITLSDGVMAIGGFGDPIGNHRATSKVNGRSPNFTAISQTAVFGRIPAVSIKVSTPFLLKVADFEDLELADESHMSVSNEDDDNRTEFQSGSFSFNTGCMHEWKYWYWFGYANSTATKFESMDDQWNNIVGGGYDGSKNYGMAFLSDYDGPTCATVLADEPQEVPGCYVTNSAWAYVAMANGYAPATKFKQGDWFLLTIKGYDANEELTGTKEFYLADLRSADASEHYIVNDWRYVDLSGLGKVKKIHFELTSSDNGSYGMNTPAYFCIDNLGATGTEEQPEGNLPTGISNVKASSNQTAQTFDLSGRQTTAAQRGIRLVRQADGSVRKMVIK